MGVPKFFRWMSERYPCLSEVVKEYQIPEFDNLYLDMNGIIHPCSHPDDSNPHFRITEETIFNNIFHYIEVLFRMIRPKKVFFMAVDGVAPRAKMNQQRGRRFRSVREAQDREREARNRGEVLPTEKRFDSNCITPGTGFMVRLNAQLRYFVARKISSDPLWQGIRVILSGHDVPGEGEHKVMEFIRYEKSLPEYDHNTRHCLYGLDADLIVLGLCTHEPHFSLLREEVLFTKQQTKRTTVPEEMTFYLLHLSLFREYLGYEFADLQKTLPFPYDLERIIDDWVMLGFLVGNDFVPHLPNLHIRENALPIVYRCYKQVLPTLDGYINDGGTLVLDRFEALMQALAQWELDRLDDQAADQRWLESKRQQGTMDIRYNGKDGKGKKRDKKKADIKLKGRDDFEMFAMFDGLDVAAGEEEELEPVKKKSVFNEIHTNIDDELLEGDESISELEYRQQRRHYYQTKMDVDICPEEALKLAVEYVRAIQWILHYYYDGVCSWSWFYPSHYAPYIGDVKGFSAVPDVVKYDYGQPFLPYEQLLAVLPAASQDSLPECLRPLMTSPSSPIIDYYPEDFETDLNGKTQDWEAVVLIPFIDQTRLLAAIRPLYEQLTPEQASRNVHGDAHMIEYTAEDQGRTESPGYFAPLAHTYARVTPRPRDPFIAERRDLRKGLLPGAHLDVLAAGFPTLRHIQHSFHLSRCKVKVFQQASMGDNMMLTVKTPWGDDQPDAEAEARRLLGRTIFVQWPHLTEATVVAVATLEKRYSLPEGAKEGDKPIVQKLNDTDRTVWIGHMHDIKNEYEGRMGILTDDIPVLVYAKPLTGRKHVATTDGRVMLQKQWSTVPRPYALQTCVRELKTLEGSYTEYKTVGDLFSKGSHCFVLATDSYASMGKVIEVTEKGRVRLDVTLTPEPDFTAVQRKEQRLAAAYFPSYVVAQKLGITSHLVSRLTGCLLIEPGGGVPANNGASNIVGELEDAKVDRDAKFNCAIEVKHNKKNEEMPGYSRRKDNQWMYSGRMIDTLREYMSKFPELIEFLGRNTEGFKFKEGDVWPQPETRAKRVRELKAWLKQLPCANTDRWPCGAPLLEDEVVKALEQAVDSHQPPRPRTRLSVKPHLLYKPSQIGGCSPPDPQATYQLYDRVVNVREGFSVPLGAKGTVIGIRESPEPADVLYDVLYDEPFEGGLALRCSAGRGYKMPPFSLMNISHGLRLKLGQTGQPVANAAAFAGAGYPMNGSPMTGGGHSQFRHSPGSPFAEPPRSHHSSRNHAQQQQPRDARTAERQLARNSPQQAARTPEKQHQHHQQQQQQHQGRKGPQQVVTPVASRASPAGGGSPHHRRVAGSGRLAHLANQTPPPIPTCGDTFTDIWQDLQRAAAAAPMPPPPAGIGHEAPARQVLPVSASSLPGGLLPVPVPSLASPAPATGGRPRPVITGQAPAQPVVPVVTQGSCDRLLRLLQNSDGGVPRYTFATADSGAVVATVALPNGRTLRGAAASTKDQAASLAAAAALTELGSSQPAGEHGGGSGQAGGRRQQQQQQQQSGADFLSLLRSPVRATMPPPAMPPPAAGDITHSLLQMLGQRAPAPAPGPAAAASAAPVPAALATTPAHGTPQQAAAKKPVHPAVAPGGSAAHSRDHGQQQRKPAPHSAPQPAHGGRQPPPGGHPAVNGAHGGQGGRGGQGGFVPMQVTKKSTPKKPEPGAAGGAERKRSGSGRATTDAPTPPDAAATGAEAAAAPVEGAGTVAAVADGAATQEGGSVPPNGEQAKKPAGRGRLFRRAPKNRLAAKF